MSNPIREWTDAELAPEEIEHYGYDPDVRVFAAEVLRLRRVVSIYEASQAQLIVVDRAKTDRIEELKAELERCQAYSREGHVEARLASEACARAEAERAKNQAQAVQIHSMQTPPSVQVAPGVVVLNSADHPRKTLRDLGPFCRDACDYQTYGNHTESCWVPR